MGLPGTPVAALIGVTMPWEPEPAWPATYRVLPSGEIARTSGCCPIGIGLPEAPEDTLTGTTSGGGKGPGNSALLSVALCVPIV
jgi:hypothetical protein